MSSISAGLGTSLTAFLPDMIDFTSCLIDRFVAFGYAVYIICEKVFQFYTSFYVFCHVKIFGLILVCPESRIIVKLMILGRHHY